MSDSPDRERLILEFRRVDKDPSWPMPARGSEWASGLDLAAAVEGEVTLAPGEIRLIPTGWAMALPRGYEGQVRPRSGTALKRGLTLINTPGTIDGDYRGEISLAMVNLSGAPQRIARGDRLAQLVVARVELPETVERAELSGTARGEGGFGSTGR
ncbi:MAG: dUTP diphosphatase [Deltaproteobacteria bacterium]|jgi:dUTP pyrophosphatase|nr:dUTP diphosphatase [Deltaproteobacteria bacterium]